MDRTVFNMDRSWRFCLGEPESRDENSHSSSYSVSKAGSAVGPAGKRWNDSDWRVVDLPHDYYAESGFAPENLLSHGYRTRSNAWYRKVFTMEERYKDKEFFLCFEGTAVNAEFYFNGSLMERSFSAYTESVFNITDRMYFDSRPNVLAVHIKGFETEGWWYEGAGIYRHVRLYIKDKVHIAHNGIFGKPVLKSGTDNDWTVEVETTLENGGCDDESVSVRAEIFDGDVKICESTTEPVICEYASKKPVTQRLSVVNPTRWDVDSPKLYTLCVSVIKDGVKIDGDKVRIGFRTFSIDAQKGFFLNERPLKILGTCNHQDHAGVGVAVPDSVQLYRIKRLKEMGCNGYRCSHNLPSKEILDACDELGMIVMDENRRFESRDEVLEYVEIMVRRDRNHPSVIFWSLFNEEPLQNTEEGAKIFRRMRSVVRRLDDTRLITGAINGSMEGAGLEMDVVGINYNIGGIEAMHKLHPSLPVIGSENNSAVSTRGVYETDNDAHILNCRDEETVPWGQTIRQTWEFTRSHDYFAGIFIWTGFDYRGEPTPYSWPSVSSQFGIMDTCGFAKDSFYFNKACFTQEPMVHLLPHWNHKIGDTVRVMAITNCDEVELFLNGASLGRKASDICTDTPEWLVDYVPGSITAKAYRAGECVAETERKTAGEPVAIQMTAVDESILNDGQCTAILNVCVTDENGVDLPSADNLIHFEVIGDGFIRGVGNGDPNSHESDVLPERKLFNGCCQALVTSNPEAENITVRAWSDGLKESAVILNVIKTQQPLCPKTILSCPLDGFTMSDITSEKPNPLVDIADNDMNSFVPVQFDGGYQKDFIDGWRIFRVIPNIISDGSYGLTFERISLACAEIYVNGELLEKIDSPHYGMYKTSTFFAEAGSTPDIRILMCTRNADANQGSGISRSVKLFEERR